MTNIVPAPPTNPPKALDGSRRWGILARNDVTQILEVVPFKEQSDDLKKKLAKNNEVKMVLYNALPKKEYERIFMCKTAKDIRAKVTTIEESKDLSSLALDELIDNLKVHEVVMEKDSEIYRGKKNFKKFFRRKGKFVRQLREEKKSFRQRDEKKVKSDQKCFRCGDPNHLIGDRPKPSHNKDQKAFIGGLGFDNSKASTSGTKIMGFVGSSAKNATDGSTIMRDGSTLPGSECLRTCLEPDEWIKDSGCSKHMTGNKSLFSTYKSYARGYSQNSKTYVVLNKHTLKVKESLNVTFDESPPSTKLSLLVDEDVGEEEAIRMNTKIVNTKTKDDESIEADEIVNIKESKNHPLYKS
nr:retrovirus-related Pol polyprotein from transposon TNT 1-94 [Tanacetum cinerariifolium]